MAITWAQCEEGKGKGKNWAHRFPRSRWLIKLMRELKCQRLRTCQSQMDGIVQLSPEARAGAAAFFPPSATHTHTHIQNTRLHSHVDLRGAISKPPLCHQISVYTSEPMRTLSCIFFKMFP